MASHNLVAGEISGVGYAQILGLEVHVLQTQVHTVEGDLAILFNLQIAGIVSSTCSSFVAAHGAAFGQTLQIAGHRTGNNCVTCAVLHIVVVSVGVHAVERTRCNSDVTGDLLTVQIQINILGNGDILRDVLVQLDVVGSGCGRIAACVIVCNDISKSIITGHIAVCIGDLIAGIHFCRNILHQLCHSSDDLFAFALCQIAAGSDFITNSLESLFGTVGQSRCRCIIAGQAGVVLVGHGVGHIAITGSTITKEEGCAVNIAVQAVPVVVGISTDSDILILIEGKLRKIISIECRLCPLFSAKPALRILFICSLIVLLIVGVVPVKILAGCHHDHHFFTQSNGIDGLLKCCAVFSCCIKA